MSDLPKQNQHCTPLHHSTMSECFPIEVVELILCCLPAKSLIRFRAVCKTWNKLIKNPKFISAHLNHQRSIAHRNGLLLFRSSQSKFSDPYSEAESESYSLRLDREPFDEYLDIEFPFEEYGPMVVVGTCDGLICLATNSYLTEGFNFIIWNPCIRRFQMLPLPNVPLADGSFVGFGYDSKTDDYKIVGVEHSEEQISSPAVGIYSLATNKWRVSSAVPSESVVSSRSCCAFVEGALHWCATNCSALDQVPDSFIMFFDFEEEEFGELELPEVSNLVVHGGLDDMSVFWLYASVSACKDSLALIITTPASHLHVWVMKEYGVVESWTKILHICLQDPSRGILNGLGFRRNGEIVLDCSGRVVSQDPQTQQLKHLKVSGHELFFDNYVESLLLLRKATDRKGKNANAVKTKGKMKQDAESGLLDDEFQRGFRRDY